MKLTLVLRTALQCFTQPFEVLRRLMERGDRRTGWIAAGASLVLSLPCGMILTRGLLRQMLEGIVRLTGARLDGIASSLQYIAGRAAPAAAGMSVLCCMAALFLPAIVYLLAGCFLWHADASSELISGYLAVTSAPHIAAQLLCLLFSFFSPWAGLAALVCGMAVSQVTACHTLMTHTGAEPSRAFPVRILCAAVSLALVLAAWGMILRQLAPEALQSMQALLLSAGGIP